MDCIAICCAQDFYDYGDEAGDAEMSQGEQGGGQEQLAPSGSPKACARWSLVDAAVLQSASCNLSLPPPLPSLLCHLCSRRTHTE